MQQDEMSPETLIAHLGEEKKPYGAVSPPIVHSSIYKFDSVDEWVDSLALEIDGDHVYTRTGNPTRALAEQKLAALEGMEACRLFSSGMAAISAAFLSCLKSGDHVVAVDMLYGPARKLLNEKLVDYGISVTYVPGEDPADFAKAIQPNTKVVYLESPSSVVFRLQDIEAVSKIAHEAGATVIIDNSYSTPLFQQPGRFGADIVVHSVSKFIAGHSDVVAGAVCTSSERVAAMNVIELDLLGAALSPFSAWLTLRGLRTLPLRVNACADTADIVVAHIKKLGFADKILHVGDDDFGQKELRDKQMKRSAGLFSFLPPGQDEESTRVFIESLELFQLAVSWGGYESLVVVLYAEPMDWPKTLLVRLYCGLESPDDLCADIEQAARKAGWI
jgi:cystathionine beta-lyase/cystathionine gamma-synthase